MKRSRWRFHLYTQENKEKEEEEEKEKEKPRSKKRAPGSTQGIVGLSWLDLVLASVMQRVEEFMCVLLYYCML